MTVVVDTNILFSAFLNAEGSVARPLISGQRFFRFIAPEYIHEELDAHRHRIMQFARIDLTQFLELHHLLLRNVTVVSLAIAPEKTIVKAQSLCEAVDPDDFPFVALGLHMKAPLWTGDKKLMKGLRQHKDVQFITTNELHQKLLAAEVDERLRSRRK